MLVQTISRYWRLALTRSEDDYRMGCRKVSHCQQQSWTTITQTTITTTITTITPTITTYL